jgi:hypothetical protein
VVVVAVLDLPITKMAVEVVEAAVIFKKYLLPRP